MIWMDKDFMSDNCKKDTYVSPLADDSEMPCDTCPLYEACLTNQTECSAMRNWCSKGDFKDTDIQRLLRGMSIN